jgi:hypothetical protein
MYIPFEIEHILLEPHRINNPQVAGEIRVENIRITHVNTMKLISF